MAARTLRKSVGEKRYLFVGRVHFVDVIEGELVFLDVLRQVDLAPMNQSAPENKAEPDSSERHLLHFFDDHRLVRPDFDYVCVRSVGLLVRQGSLADHYSDLRDLF